MEVALNDVLKKLQQHVKVRFQNDFVKVKTKIQAIHKCHRILSIARNLLLFNHCQCLIAHHPLLHVVKPALEQLLAELVANPGSEQLRRLLAVRFGQSSMVIIQSSPAVINICLKN